MEYITGRMEEFIKATGKKVNNMVLVGIEYPRKVRRSLDCGKMVKELIGLMRRQ